MSGRSHCHIITEPVEFHLKKNKVKVEKLIPSTERVGLSECIEVSSKTPKCEEHTYCKAYLLSFLCFPLH